MGSSPLNTSQVIEALRQRYCPKDSHRVADRWAFLTEVRNDAGHRARRSCDAIAMGLWPSEGLRLHGHEIKVSRADWKKELDDPSKSDAFVRFCHAWWIVAPKGVVVLDELPATWGLMVVSDSLAVKVQRPATINLKPEPVSYGFLASLLRRSLEQDQVAAMVRRAREEGFRAGSKYADQRIADMEKRLEQREQARMNDAVATLKAFEDASGFRLSRWDAKGLGEAAKLLDDLDPQRAAHQLAIFAGRAAGLSRALAELFPAAKES